MSPLLREAEWPDIVCLLSFFFSSSYSGDCRQAGLTR